MNREKKLPVSDVLAEMNSVEYYNGKSKLGAGTYSVIEYDGEINYVSRNGFGGESWYSEEEYQAALADRSRDDYLHQQMMFEPEDEEELMDSWDNAMIHQEGERLADEISMAGDDEFRRVDPHVFAEDNGFGCEVEHTDEDIVNDDRVDDDQLIVEMSSPGKTLGELLREHMVAIARPHIEADDMSEAEYENHRSELGAFNQRSSEQLDHAMATK